RFSQPAAQRQAALRSPARRAAGQVHHEAVGVAPVEPFLLHAHVPGLLPAVRLQAVDQRRQRRVLVLLPQVAGLHLGSLPPRQHPRPAPPTAPGRKPRSPPPRAPPAASGPPPPRGHSSAGPRPAAGPPPRSARPMPLPRNGTAPARPATGPGALPPRPGHAAP